MTSEDYQTTIEQEVHFEGVGLHTGEKGRLTLYPAPENTGIVFVDSQKKQLFKATIESVQSTSYCVALAGSGVTVKTVEHLLSALQALPISNVFIYCQGPEIPIMDGSSWHFIFHLKAAGIKVQKEKKLYAVVNKNLIVEAGQAKVVITPHNAYMIEVTLEYAHPFLAKEGLKKEFLFERQTYEREIARARTYGFTSDEELYKKQHLALGAGPHNVLIFDDYQPVSHEPPRFTQEVVRHKILDVIGDLSLIGAPLIGSYQAYCPGHTLNTAAVRALLNQDAISWMTYEELQSSSKNMLVP